MLTTCPDESICADFGDFVTLNTYSGLWRENKIGLMNTFKRAGVLLALVCGVWGGSPRIGFGESVTAQALGQEDIAVTIRIERRRFIPHVVHLRVGQQVRLILKNEDVELHAFVPTNLLVRTNVQVSGDGAPQFGKDGLRRVLIPSDGQAELVFVSKEAGSFPFFCDLPGHIMNGTIVVDG